MKKYINKFKYFILLFIILEFLFISIINHEKEQRKLNYQNEQTKLVSIEFKTIYNLYKQLSLNTFNGIINKPAVIDIFKNAKDAKTTEEKKLIRDSLYEVLKDDYVHLKTQGFKQIHFHLPNNESFLRLHKKERFGDNLSAVRYSVKYVNKNKKTIDGLEEGRIVHGFRYIYPLFDEHNNHIGSVETSIFSKAFKTEMEKHFNVDVHFLMDKSVVNKKLFKDYRFNYVQSMENENYLYSKEYNEYADKRGISISLLNKELSDTIDNKLKTKESFTINFCENKNQKIGTFIAIQNLEKNKVVAYFVAYQYSKYLDELNKTFIIFIVATTIGLLLFVIFIYGLIADKKTLIKRVDKKTKQLKILNEELEEKVYLRTKEQNLLLSLFDKGDIVLFKWKNDENWSVEYVSQSVEKLLGYTTKEFLDNKIQYARLIEHKYLSTVTKEVNSAIVNNIEFFKHEPYKIVTKDNTIKWILDYTVVVRDEYENVINFVGYLSDITLAMNHQIKLEEEIDKRTKELINLNENLETQITQEISKSRDKDTMLFQQSKMAAMGEMLANIAHQWRQPLNAISVSASSMQVQYELDLLNDDKFNNGINGIVESTNFLSNTIDDFKNYLKPDNDIVEFDIKDTIEKSLQLVVATLNTNNIEVIINIDPINILGRKGEFTQVILNIINNAKDALVDNNDVRERFIFVNTILLDNKIVIQIKDNAGGIPNNILENIFDQYFTTKDIDGTGIGLHMSKQIIQEHLNGGITVENIEYDFENKKCKGACFNITLPTS